MRIKDELKQDALFNATIKLVNEIGFVASSVSKIAREADVSPATIYVYYKNKEDLLLSTYINIKQILSEEILRDFDDSLPIRDTLKNLWLNMFRYIAKHPEQFQYSEQFANSPYCSLVNKADLDSYFEPVYRILNKGIEQKIIKNVSMDILATFIFYPIVTLANKRLCEDFPQNEDNIETAFTLAWDAIKL
jgi:AcrR family transcriptional regulator